MSAQQLFDYLEGRLTAGERAELDRRIASEPALQQDLKAAQEIVRGFSALKNAVPPPDLLARTRRQIRASGTVVVESPETRRDRGFPQWAWPVSAAAIVLIGGSLLFIHENSGKRNEPLAATSETAARPNAEAPPHSLPADAPITPDPASGIASLNESLARTAEKNIPTPTLATEKIDIPSPAGELRTRTDEVMRIVTASGGIALKGNATAGEERVLASIPQEELENFRRAIASVSSVEPGRDLKMDQLSGDERESVRQKLRQLDDRTTAGGKLAAAQPQAADKDKAAEAPKERSRFAAREESHAVPLIADAPASTTPAPAPMGDASLAKEIAGPALPAAAGGGFGGAAAKKPAAKMDAGIAESKRAAKNVAPKPGGNHSGLAGTLRPDSPAKAENETQQIPQSPVTVTGVSAGTLEVKQQNAAESGARKNPSDTGSQSRRLIEIIIHTAPAAK